MTYDVIIIGKGPAGLSAALYTTRGKLITLIIGKDSSLSKAKTIENYCCSESMSGEDLIAKGVEQANSFGASIIDEEVVAIKNKDDVFVVSTNESDYEARSILISTGKEKLRIPIKNINKFEGKGVHYCVACDGFFYSNSKVGLIGYTDYAIHELRELEAITQKITLFTNGNELQINNENLKYLKEKNININYDPIDSIEGEKFIEKLVFKNSTKEEIDGLFIAYGSASSVDFARNLGIDITNNNILVDDDQKTNIDGIYAAGDCTGVFPQIAIAVGQGAIAGQEIKNFINRMPKLRHHILYI